MKEASSTLHSKTRRLRAMIALAITTSSLSVNAAQSPLSYHGRILNPDGTPLISAGVEFKIQIRTPGLENCLLYEETLTQPMVGSAGLFTLTINRDGANRTDSYSTRTLDLALSNRTAFTLIPGDCVSGATTYTPTLGEGRRLSVSFRVSPMASYEDMPAQALNYAPLAIDAKMVAGFGAGNLLKVETANAATTLTTAQLNELVALTNGSSTQFVKMSGTTGAALPVVNGAPSTPAPGSIWFDSSTNKLQYSDGSGTPVVLGSSTGGTVTSVATGAGLTGGPISTTGTISLATLGTGGTGTKLTYDTYGRVSGFSLLAETDIPILTTSGRVLGSAISGTIGGSTSVSTSGNIQTSQSMTARRLYLYDTAGAGPGSVGFQAPATIASPYLLTLPPAQSGSNQTLVNDGSGVLSWTNMVAQDLTSITGTGIVQRNGPNSYSTVNVVAPINYAAGNLGLNTASGGVVLDGGNTVTGAMSIGTNAAFDLGFRTNSANRLTIASGGNVGIGTDTPTSKLEVGGGLKIASGSESCVATGDGGRLRYSGTDLQFCNGSSWQTLGISGAGITAETDPTVAAFAKNAPSADFTTPSGVLTLATIGTGKGGTGLTTLGTANQILGINTAATGYEFKSLAAGSGVTITPTAGVLTIAATGAGGTVTTVSSANADIAVVNPSTAPVLTLNSGVGANQILKLNASSQIPSIDGSLITNLTPANLSAAVPLNKGGTGQVTALASFNALSPLTTKGDLATHDGTNNIRFPAGADGKYLKADAAQISGLTWADVMAQDLSSMTGTGIVQRNGSASYSTVNVVSPLNYAAGNLGLNTVSGGVLLDGGNSVTAPMVVGPTTSQNLVLRSGGNQNFTLDTSGNIRHESGSSSYNFILANLFNRSQLVLDTYTNSSTGNQIIGRKGRNFSATTPTTPLLDAVLLAVAGKGYDGNMTTFNGTGWDSGIEFRANEDFSATNHGSRTIFWNTPNGTAAKQIQMVIMGNGFTGINNAAPGAALDVATIRANAFGQSVGIQGAANVPNVPNTGLNFVTWPVHTTDVNFDEYGAVVVNGAVVPSGRSNTGSETGLVVRTMRNFVNSGDSGSINYVTAGELYYGHTNAFAATPITNQLTGLSLVPKAQSGSITTLTDLWIHAKATGGTVGTHVGLYQEDSSIRNSFMGSLGVGVSVPTEKLHVLGNLRVQGTTDCTLGNGSGGTSCTSDKRLKSNVTEIESALAKILALRGVEFDWNQKSQSPGRHAIGVIAQDVEKVFPTAVTTDPSTGYKKVDYAVLVAPLISASKELHEGVEEIRAENAKLRAENADLRARMDRIEKSLGGRFGP